MGGMYSKPCDICGTRHEYVHIDDDHPYTLAGIAPPPVLSEPPPPPPQPDRIPVPRERTMTTFDDLVDAIWDLFDDWTRSEQHAFNEYGVGRSEQVGMEREWAERRQYLQVLIKAARPR